MTAPIDTPYLYNNTPVNQQNIKISAVSLLINAGSGFFETVLYKNQRLYFWQQHLNRLNNSLTAFSKTLKADLPNQKTVESFLTAQNCPSPSRIKLTAFPGMDNNIWDWIITYQPYQHPTKEFSLKISEETADYPLLKHKSLNYWQNLINIQSEDSNTETARLNRFGNINEGSKTNILVIKNQQLYYSSRQNNYLSGITQQILLDNYSKIGLSGIKSCKEGLSLADLKTADQIFLTNSLMPVASVNNLYLNKRNFGVKSDSELVKRIAGLIENH